MAVGQEPVVPGDMWQINQETDAMKIALSALRRKAVERLLIESVDLSLYIAHAEIDGERYLITDAAGRVLKTANLMAMKEALLPVRAEQRLLLQRSAYDEMVGQGFEPADNAMEIPLGPGYETLPRWQH
jgi:hypothetical protein